MPWECVTLMDRRREFCAFARQPDANISELCRRFGISRPTAYRWLERAMSPASTDEDAYRDRSHRPHTSPRQTSAAMEAQVVAVRDEFPTWGSWKIWTTLHTRGVENPPAPNTITAILHRHDLIDPAVSVAHRTYHRFEAEAPNDLLQMDFTGHFPVGNGRCHPLPILDDHSRFLLDLEACPHERGTLVRERLTAVFRRYGQPTRLLCDNGPPWGTKQAGPQLTVLTVWLIRHGITVIHGRPFHPQTQGKIERLSRTLNADVIAGRTFRDLVDVQAAFRRFRESYNAERPHDALGLATPLSRYLPSPRAFVDVPPPIEYAPGDIIRPVDSAGRISWQGRRWNISDALDGEHVGIRPTLIDGVFDVRFCDQIVRTLSLQPA